MKFFNRPLILSLALLYGFSGFTLSLAVVETILPGGCVVDLKKRRTSDASFIRHINQKKILAEQKAIVFLLQKHKIARFSLQAGAAAVALYYLYSYSKSWFGSEQKPAAGGVKAKKVAKAKESFMQWAKNVPGRAGNALITWDTYLTVGKWTANIGTYAVINKVFGDFITNINHSNTFSWLTRTRAPFEKALNELKEYAQLLENNEVAGDERAYTQQALVSTANALVSDVEKVCAFMQYKLKTSDIPVDKKLEASSIISYVIEHTNAFVDTLELQRAATDKVTLTVHVDAFKDKLTREVKHFARIDEEKDWEEEMRELGVDLNNLMANNRSTQATKKKAKVSELVKA